ncbi:ketol-acid reductoisomerase [Candidatus Methylacidithermus pantelleriae]|uniref:Ketol-acid reductoisomerase (NADP(+)) n=1 Tax=Candidatus Methylacidithermus pantelleriae TaxID=2744239 RepID=A0A8J2FWH9_9BACT|nr:ketol-acid reductoisomerase [Candidatus Methylacidithermus pantelleriae]CAF0699090.1 Ketol-acid reductoisomerase (NADP(+)) [Candidatus Methylacidithermus pantelleriae]
MSLQVYREEDADLGVLKGLTFAVVGFGSQGHAHALNLRDSGVRVVVGLRPRSRSTALAREFGLEVTSVSEAARLGDVIFLAVPDMAMPEVFREEILPQLVSGKTLGFAHGFCIHYGTIHPPANVDVILVAPKGPGHLVRRQFLQGQGVPALFAVHQDATGKAKATALAWAKGIGATRAGVLETTFKDETETDLFGEQAVLCGGTSALILAGFETLVEAGYPPELAYFECVHELKLIVDLINESGLSGMRFSISETAKWGDLTVGPKIIDGHVREQMKEVLKQIQNGSFAKEWIAEAQAGKPRYEKLLKEARHHPLEKVGARLRKLMPWMAERKTTGAQAEY